MTTEVQLWWQVRERIAAQAWSCDDATWDAPFGAQTVGSLLAAFADSTAATRLEVARSLQERSESREIPADNPSAAIVHGWLTLRKIDAALGRPPIDLRSEVAEFVGNYVVARLVENASDAGQGLTLKVTGPGFLTSVTNVSGVSCTATMSWLTLIGLATGVTSIEVSAIDLQGDDDAIDHFIDSLVALPATLS